MPPHTQRLKAALANDYVVLTDLHKNKDIARRNAHGDQWKESRSTFDGIGQVNAQGQVQPMTQNLSGNAMTTYEQAQSQRNSTDSPDEQQQ